MKKRIKGSELRLHLFGKKCFQENMSTKFVLLVNRELMKKLGKMNSRFQNEKFIFRNFHKHYLHCQIHTPCTHYIFKTNFNFSPRQKSQGITSGTTIKNHSLPPPPICHKATLVLLSMSVGLLSISNQ